MTSGVKEACSISHTRCSYARFFSFLSFEKHLSRLVRLLDGARGLNTLTSRNILSSLPPQKPLAAMSNLAPSSVFAVRLVIVSVVISCRSGSTLTSLHTSVNRVAVKSLISLWRREWRREGKPPRGQESKCSTTKLAPHTQVVGVFNGAQP